MDLTPICPASLPSPRLSTPTLALLLSLILTWQAWPHTEPQRPASQRRKVAPELHCEGLRDLRGLPRHPVLAAPYAARPGA